MKMLFIAGLLFFVFHSFAQQNISDSIQHQSYQRKYIVHIPPGYSDNTSSPLIITLHGGSGNYQSVQGFTEMNFISNQNDFLVVYPQGYGIASPGYSWADGRGTTADQANIDDVGFIANLIDTLSVDYNLNKNMIYVCGFSNGGFMTQRLACEIPERFAAIGGLGCSMDTSLILNCNPSKPVAMAYFSGTEDPEVPYMGGAMNNPAVTPIVPVDTAVQFWVKNNNCQIAEPVVYFPDKIISDNSTVELFKYTDCDCDADFYFYKIINGGHTWPGVPVPQYPQLGNTNQDIHASYLLWEFFKTHSLCNNVIIFDNQSEKKLFRIYPNPAKDIVFIETNRKIAEVILYDFMGKKILRDKQEQINIENLRAGLYFVSVKFMDKTTKTVKLFKE